MIGQSPVKARQKPDKRMPMACQRQPWLAKGLAEVHGATVVSKRAS